MMKVIEYIGEVLPDGYLSLLEEIQKELGLSPHCSVKVTIAVEDSRVLDEKKGWEAFRRMRQDAVGGKLSNASAKHDQYLYGRTGERDERNTWAEPAAVGISSDTILAAHTPQRQG